MKGGVGVARQLVDQEAHQGTGDWVLQPLRMVSIEQCGKGIEHQTNKMVKNARRTRLAWLRCCRLDEENGGPLRAHVPGSECLFPRALPTSPLNHSQEWL